MPINITTAIDSLVDLVKLKKKITLEDASHELGIPTNIIDEWSSFLEEEGIIERVYKFTTPFLVIKEQKEEFSEQDLRQRLDLATRHLEFILIQLNKYKIKHEYSIEDIQDIRILLKKNPNKFTKEIVFAQKFILEYEANELLKMIKKIRLLTPELMIYTEKKINDLDKRREIFENNYNKLK